MQLSEKQLQNYKAFNKRFGLDDGHSSTIPAAEHDGDLILSKDPAQSTIPPKLITVECIESLKKIIDLTPSASDDQINYPAPYKTAEAGTQLTSEHKQHLKKVLRCCVAGDLNKIASSDKEMLEKVAFPMTLAAFALENHTVKSGEVLKLTDGVTANFGTLTIDAGGQIECDGNAFLNCQSLIQVGTQQAGDYTFDLSLPAISPSQANSGDDGMDGGKGASGNNGARCASHCKKAPTDGGQGHSGGDGGNGEHGAHGVHGPILQCQINNVTGNISVNVGAQSGQQGGNGGKGGNGGPGGDPGSNPGNVCKSASSGPTGTPGHGGTGGDGGNGGDGAQLYLLYGGSPSFSSTTSTSDGGKGGSAGLGGNNNTSYNGADGAGGKGGAEPVFEPTQL